MDVAVQHLTVAATVGLKEAVARLPVVIPEGVTHYAFVNAATYAFLATGTVPASGDAVPAVTIP